MTNQNRFNFCHSINTEMLPNIQPRPVPALRTPVALILPNSKPWPVKLQKQDPKHGKINLSHHHPLQRSRTPGDNRRRPDRWRPGIRDRRWLNRSCTNRRRWLMRTHGAGANRPAGQVWAHWARADRLLRLLRLMRTHGARENRLLRQMRAHRARTNGASRNLTIGATEAWRGAARASAWGWGAVCMRAVGGAAAGSRCGRRRMDAVWPAVTVRRLNRRPLRVVVPGAGAAGDDGLDCEGPGDSGETGLQGGAGA